MSLRLAKLVLSLFPLVGAAQTLPSLAPQSSSRNNPLVEQLLALDAAGRPMLAQGAPVLPIWSGADGKLLAVVALPQSSAKTPLSMQATAAYAGPSAWHLSGSSSVGAGGVRWQLGNGGYADAMIGEYLSATPASLCNSGHCAASASTWSRRSLAGSLGMGWNASALDLSYGLSWLQSNNSGATLGRLSADSALIPVLTLPDAQAYALDNETSLYARGRWQFDNGPALNVGASFGRGQLSAIGTTAATSFGPGIDLDQLSLSLGLDAGSLRGAIVGHVMSSDDPALAGRRWSTLDLGVSWRTPWSGELSVGAQNLWTAPLNSPRDAENQARTPYIQYRQDL